MGFFKKFRNNSFFKEVNKIKADKEERNSLLSEERESLLLENKKSKKTCVWILALLIPACVLSVLFTIETVKDNFLFIFLAIGVWVGMNVMLSKARENSKPILGLKEVFLFKITSILTVVACVLSVFISIIALVI